MKPLDRILERARSQPKRIALAEGADPRILDAAVRAACDGIAVPILVGPLHAIEDGLRQRGAKPGDFQIVDPGQSDLRGVFEDAYFDLRREKGATPAQASAAMGDPMGFCAMLVRLGHADGMVGGAVATTAHTVRTALQIIGRAPGTQLVSSFFLMMLCAPEHKKKGAFLFADCGLVVEPNEQELAEIALASARSCRALTGEQPRVAMLSFSTMGSAIHDKVDKVRAAVARVRSIDPGLMIDGELQFDAAFVPLVSDLKAPGSATKGEANVFVFPNLEAGNIGYKIAQRIGGAVAIGPVLQGLAKPANDLSRGCDADDVYAMIAITSVQASSEPVAAQERSVA